MKALLLAFVVALPACTNPYMCNAEKKIAQVGGCSKTGWCGVLYEDGTKGHRIFPVVGERVQAYVPCK